MTMDVETLAQLQRIVEQGTEPTMLERGCYYVVKLGDRVHTIDLTGDEYLDLPPRIEGTAEVENAASFLTYWGLHADPNSNVFASRARLAVVGVLDANSKDEARWQDHKVRLDLRLSDQFSRWKQDSGKRLSQLDFADMIEDRREGIVQPAAANLLELVQSFQSVTKVTFRSAIRLKDGRRQLTYVEDGGTGGELAIPDQFIIQLPVFRGDDQAEQLAARLRYRIEDGKLYMTYILDGVEEAIDRAFSEVVDTIAQGTAVEVMMGSPTN